MCEIKSAYYFWEDKIKGSGFRLTETRKIILKAFLDNHGEYTAEEFCLIIHKKNPEIGIATVYRNIRLMKKIGLISKSYAENKKAKYRLKNFKEKSLRRKFDKHDIDMRQEQDQGLIYSSKHLNTSTTEMDIVLRGYNDSKNINGLQVKVSKWLNSLNKLKNEREIELEEITKDLSNIDKILQNHQYDRGNLIQMLLDIQEEYNWLPKHTLYYASNKLGIPLTNIYNIASFYKYFKLEPQGKHNILVCMGTACHVRNSMNLLQRVVNVLGIKAGDTTTDYKFTLDTVNCLGVCALGPVMMVDNKYYSNPSNNKIKKIFSKFD
ncbi:MAG: NAD(P)H-dependent oxidoreductase subunit E [Actinobacteria bacterium]|nr:NAD(P)H-dependent oxidoreductase subunit E [Actinomycetota bacterium]